jgi:hypothetical protein
MIELLAAKTSQLPDYIPFDDSMVLFSGGHPLPVFPNHPTGGGRLFHPDHFCCPTAEGFGSHGPTSGAQI